MVKKFVAASLALIVVVSLGGCFTAPVQRIGYTGPATSQTKKITPSYGYTNRARRAVCGSFDQVSFGADGEATVDRSRRARVCQGPDGKLREN
jgi:hypothetical protein